MTPPKECMPRIESKRILANIKVGDILDVSIRNFLDQPAIDFAFVVTNLDNSRYFHHDQVIINGITMHPVRGSIFVQADGKVELYASLYFDKIVIL